MTSKRQVRYKKTNHISLFLYDVIDEQNHLVYRDVDEDKDIVFHDTKSITLSDYLSKHPIVKKACKLNYLVIKNST